MVTGWESNRTGRRAGGGLTPVDGTAVAGTGRPERPDHPRPAGTGPCRGSALLAVLVLGLVLSLMAGLGVHLVLSEIRLNRAFCDGVRAYYLAESGLVWGLAQARRALEEGVVPPAPPPAPANPFSGVYEEPHGFDLLEFTVSQTKGGEGNDQAGGSQAAAGAPGQEGGPRAAPGQAARAGASSEQAKTAPGQDGRAGDGTGPPAAYGGNVPEGTPDLAAGTGGTPVVESTVPEAAGSGRGGGAREYEITLKSAGWYGEGRRAVRIMEARITTRVTPGQYNWRVDYWRQEPH